MDKLPFPQLVFSPDFVSVPFEMPLFIRHASCHLKAPPETPSVQKSQKKETWIADVNNFFPAHFLGVCHIYIYVYTYMF